MRQRNLGRMRRQLIGALGGAVILLLGAGSAHALVVKNATLLNGTVTVSGSQASPSAQISWEGSAVAVANKQGNFGFSTNVVPADCMGTVSDGTSVDVLITGCTPAPPPPPTAFPATGQTQCYDSSNALTDCANVTTSQDGKVRAGAALSYTDNGNGTITDNNTGLVWEKKTDANVGTSRTWQQAFDYVAQLNAMNGGAGFAGHNDWRLPNVKELQSIVDYGRFAPAIDPTFGLTAMDGYYLSSTSYVYNPAYAWGVNFLDGVVDAQFQTFIGNYVRAVRGGL